MSKRAWAGGSPHLYIWVHENARDQGFHTHQLMYVPRVKAGEFEAWARGCLARLMNRPVIHPETLVLRVHKPRNEADAVARQWDWFKYITKTLCPDAEYWTAEHGFTEARAIFKPYPFIEGEPVRCRQLASGSREIWTQAQQKAGFVSRFAMRAWDNLYDGSELEARRDEADRREFEAKLETLNL